MDTYGQFCPVAVASEVFAQRWTPLVLRELLAGSNQFNAIKRGLPLIPKTTLAARLRALERAGVVTCESQGPGKPTVYRLTESGLRFRGVIEKLGEWGQHCAQRFEPQNLDAELLMWNIRRRLDPERLPANGVILRFEFTGTPPRRARIFWLKVRRPDAELCLKDPGGEVDLYVHADIGAFARVWLGEERFANAVDEGRIRLVGDRALARSFPSWLLLSHFAPHGSVHAAEENPAF
jgi:DNA-binding HxlR family transcriptional regulator